MNNRTIERIKKRFIGISMLAIFLAMVFIGGAILLTSFFVSRSAIRRGLDQLILNEAYLKDRDLSEYYFDSPDITDIFNTQVGDQADFWLVRYDAEGQLLSVDGRYPGNSYTFFLGMADEIKEGPEGYGRQGRIWYKYADTLDGSIIAFIDTTGEIYAINRLLFITLIVCLAGLAVTFILVTHFADYAVASEAENLAKQKDFITNASHELKTPLAVIRANTEMSQMLNGEDEWSVSTMKQIDRMNGLITNLVMISKAEELEDKEQMVSIDASAAVSDSVKSFESVAANSGISLVTDIPSGIMMTADASKIMQLTTLLTDNAIKYCDENGTVKVELAPARRGIRLTVTNSYKDGAGVDCDRFFDRFYREDQSHNIDKGGYGIGLSIAENICKQYKGSIKASWKNGQISFVCILY
ncbi:MAG: HAMP domain-containing histidine kinase [Clostridiales bacterium]|nr:HAMP domain-containing histidine kinase [Clostridiales bacterium]